MIGETFKGQSVFKNLHKISLISIEKAPVTQPNIYSLGIRVAQDAVKLPKVNVGGPKKR